MVNSAMIGMLEYVRQLHRDIAADAKRLQKERAERLEGILEYQAMVQRNKPAQSDAITSGPSHRHPGADAPRVVQNFFHLLDVHGRADRARVSPRGFKDLMKYVRTWGKDDVMCFNDDLRYEMFGDLPVVLFGVRVERDNTLSDWEVGWDMEL